MSADRSWNAFWHDAPGRRFARRHARLHRAGRGAAARLLRGIAGALLVLVGIVLLPLPGPGFVVILLGAAVLAGESARIAALLDRAELRLRAWLRR